MRDHAIRRDRCDPEVLRLVVPPETGEFFFHMDDERAVSADEHHEEAAPALGDVLQLKRFSGNRIGECEGWSRRT